MDTYRFTRKRITACALALALQIVSPHAVECAGNDTVVVEQENFLLHKFEQQIGEETFRIVRVSDTLTIGMKFKFTDRGGQVPLVANLKVLPDTCTLRHPPPLVHLMRQPMKEKPLRRTSKAAREAAEKEVAELLPALESAAAEPEEKQAEMKKSADRARVEKTMAYTAEHVTRQIGDMQLSINRMLTDLSQQLREESGKLAEIRLAIDTENARLKELHDIDAAMLSLKAILEVAAERRAALEAELNQREVDLQTAMERKNEEWTSEQADHEARMKRAREREEEEYAYKLSLKRRKEADEYAAQQAALQKSLQEQHDEADQEIEERQRAMAARESEIKEMQMRVERFPQELAAATKQAEQAARSEAQKQAALDAKLVKMETDAERNVTALKISGLEDLLKRQTAQLEAMTKQLSAAQTQVQALAVKAIEGAAGLKSMPGQ